MADTKPQQWKKEESERLRGEGNQIKFIDVRFERASFRIILDSKLVLNTFSC